VDVEKFDRTLFEYSGADQRPVGAVASAAGIRPVWVAVEDDGGVGGTAWQGRCLYVARGTVG